MRKPSKGNIQSERGMVKALDEIELASHFLRCPG